MAKTFKEWEVTVPNKVGSLAKVSGALSEGKVNILAWDEDEKMQHRFTLTLGSAKESRGHTGNHTIHLMALNPYPRAEQTTAREDYVVLVGVTATAEDGQIINY